MWQKMLQVGSGSGSVTSASGEFPCPSLNAQSSKIECGFTPTKVVIYAKNLTSSVSDYVVVHDGTSANDLAYFYYESKAYKESGSYFEIVDGGFKFTQKNASGTSGVTLSFFASK